MLCTKHIIVFSLGTRFPIVLSDGEDNNRIGRGAHYFEGRMLHPRSSSSMDTDKCTYQRLSHKQTSAGRYNSFQPTCHWVDSYRNNCLHLFDWQIHRTSR